MLVRKTFLLSWTVLAVSQAFCAAPNLHPGLPAEARFYPAFPAERSNEAPAVRFGSAEKEPLSAEVKFAHRPEGLLISVAVSDPTMDEPFSGEELWKSDSVQIALDVKPDQHHEGYDKGCFELGFAVERSGKVRTYCFYPISQWDWRLVTVNGKRNERGYSLSITIPWVSFALDPAKRPEQIGVNVLVNDRGAAGRRFVEWTPGIGSFKAPAEFARVVFTNGESACLVRTGKPSCNIDDSIDVEYLEYAPSDLPAEEILLRAVPVSDDAKPLKLATKSLSAAPAGFLRRAKFPLPPKRLRNEGDYLLVVEKNGQSVAQTPLTITDLSKVIAIRQTEARQKLTALRAELDADPDWKRDAYLNLSLAVADRFLKRVEEVKTQPLEWSCLQMEEVVQVLSAAEGRYHRRKQTGQGPVEVSVPVPRRAAIQDGQFVADGPRFPAGYGSFEQVVRDLPNFNALGVSLVQQERGIICLEPNGTLNHMADSMVNILGQAERNKIKVDLLLSTHYFPGWAREKNPEMNNILQMGFLDYNIDHPQAREVTRRFLEAFLPRVKDAAALFSFCLANEPRYGNSGRDPHSRPAWVTYLKDRHKTIQALNALYGTNYASFDEVPVPAPTMPKELGDQRALYDWGRFNQKNFADWHAWLNDIVKRHAPGIPTHTKIMPHALWPDTFKFGIDPELMCAVTDLAGCDNCGYIPTPLWYDLLHSFRGQPVFNSELHIIGDNSPPESFPAAEIRSCLWRGVVHHLSAETMWVWEEAANHDLAGSIYFRPTAIEAAGRSMLDFQRLRHEIAAFNQAKPRVAIFYSMTSVFWQPGYAETVRSLYDALIRLGQPVTFVSERQLAAWDTRGAEWILLPQTTHAPSDAVDGLRDFLRKGGKVLSVGEKNLAWDEYHRLRRLAEEFQAMRNIDLKPTATENLPALLTDVMNKDGRIPNWAICRDAKTDQPTRGVEYRIVPFEGKTLVFLINLLDSPQIVKLPLTGPVVDRVTDEAIDPANIRLPPGEPRLLVAPPR